MKTKGPISGFSNIFEIALYERFLELGVGEPDERLREEIEKVGNEFSIHVKELLSQDYDKARSMKKELKKELRKVEH